MCTSEYGTVPSGTAENKGMVGIYPGTALEEAAGEIVASGGQRSHLKSNHMIFFCEALGDNMSEKPSNYREMGPAAVSGT